MSDRNISPLVFISHAANEDKDIASALQDWIYLAYDHKVSVFVSSKDGISVNDNPIEKLRQVLDQATVMIVLHTPASTDKQWITFESGWALGSKKAAFHILCKGVSAKDLARPLTAMDQIKDSRDVDQFFEVIACLDKAVGMYHQRETERLRCTLAGENQNRQTDSIDHGKKSDDEIKAAQRLVDNANDDRIRKEELEILRMKCALKEIAVVTNAVSEPNGKSAVGHRSSGVPAPKEDDCRGGVCPDLEHDPHVMPYIPHGKLANRISDNDYDDNRISRD